MRVSALCLNPRVLVLDFKKNHLSTRRPAGWKHLTQTPQEEESTDEAEQQLHPQSSSGLTPLVLGPRASEASLEDW